jgi:hypothetical protein
MESKKKLVSFFKVWALFRFYIKKVSSTPPTPPQPPHNYYFPKTQRKVPGRK